MYNARFSLANLLSLSGILILSGSAGAQQSAERAATPTPTLNTLWSFQGAPNDGSTPYAGAIVFDNSGNLYGATLAGGVADSGAVFQLSPPNGKGKAWTESLPYGGFGSSGGGLNPEAGTVFGSDGALYGTTYLGGATGNGTVYQIIPPARAGDSWSESVIYNFTGGTDGGNPEATLLFHNNVLYGTTVAGGSTGNGTVFTLKPPKIFGGPWTEEVIYSFAGGTDGSAPAGLLPNNGVLYGVTSGGGTGFGTVFQLLPPKTPGGPWTESVLYSFTGGDDGAYPGGMRFSKSGSLYGTTSAGGTYNVGTVFQLKPPAASGDPWTHSVIFSFQRYVSGSYPGSIMLKMGVIFGVTYNGGTGACEESGQKAGCGVIYKLTPPTAPGGTWTQTVLHDFQGGNEGQYIASDLVFRNNAFYGMTNQGGSAGYGTVFQLIP